MTHTSPLPLRAPLRPALRALALGPPHLWLQGRSLKVGEALLDGAGVAHGGRFSALCLSPVEVKSEALEALMSLTRAERQERARELLSELERLSQVHREGEGSIEPSAWRKLPCPAPLTLCALSYELGVMQMGLPIIELESEVEGEGEGAEVNERLKRLPAWWVARYEAAYVWDHQEERGWLVGVSEGALDGLAARLTAKEPSGELCSQPNATLTQALTRSPLTRTPLNPVWSREAHRHAIERAHEMMREGELYQVNLTTAMSAQLCEGVSLEQLYQRLRAKSPAPFGALVRLSERQSALCFSPERLLAWSHTGRVWTEPIKGTRPRSAAPTLDQEAQSELLMSLKDRAEHTMIVDLERNDLGRLAEAGSVRVEALRALQSYASVHHLVSHISAQRREGLGLTELIAAMLPGGSITGAPKRRSIEAIARLEATPRGLYCGALGYLSPCGSGDLNLPIRTAWLEGDQLTYHAGGGVVADSSAEGEWEELWVKSAALSQALQDP